MAGKHVRQDEAAFHEAERGLQSAGTWNRPTRLEFSMAPDVPAVLRTEVRVPSPVHGFTRTFPSTSRARRRASASGTCSSG